MQALLDGVRARIRVADDAEITMEANPGTVEADRFSGYQRAGVNRISIGVQSFSAEKLTRLGASTARKRPSARRRWRPASACAASTSI